jgi:hypothetical protein
VFLDNAPALIWEDTDPAAVSGADRWWLAHSHDEGESGIRDFFIAEDDVSGFLVGIVRSRASGAYRVIAATLLSDAAYKADAVTTIKDQIAGWLFAPREVATLGFVRRWRRRRFWVITRSNLPLAAGAFIVGGLLGLVITLFAISSGLAGWPMLVAGFLVGASAGPLLKFIADRKPKSGTSVALAGSWGRFAVVTIAAIAGAGLAAGSVLTMFWS